MLLVWLIGLTAGLAIVWLFCDCGFDVGFCLVCWLRDGALLDVLDLLVVLFGFLCCRFVG